MTVDPPPDLVLEIDVSGDSMDKLPLYAAMQVQEVWRFRDRSVEIRILEEARYVRRAKSLAIPVLDSKLISELMEPASTSSVLLGPAMCVGGFANSSKHRACDVR